MPLNSTLRVWVADKIREGSRKGVFLLASIYRTIYYAVMNTPTPAKLLEQLTQIQRMERGKLCVMRQGPDGPYYNLQGREQGKTVSRYVPRDQVEAVAEHIANHRKFMAVVEEYTEHVIEQTRRERLEGSKKKTLPPPSSWRRAKKSKT